MNDKEKVFNKLKYGTVFVCPKCGNTTFVLETNVVIRDYLELNEDGTATVQLSDLHEISSDFEQVSTVYCEKCEQVIPKQKYLELIAALEEKITYIPPPGLKRDTIVERVYNKLKYGDFPDVLSIEETYELPYFKTFSDGDANDNARDAHEFAKKVDGVVFTQVDADAPFPNDIVYLKGFHLVNRTGIYAVAWR